MRSGFLLVSHHSLHGLKSCEVAIPSKWGLVSYTLMTLQHREYQQSQSLLNEVWFPTLSTKQIELINESQSLLNEVWFPTETVGFTAFNDNGVAIPSKWGLVSYWHKQIQQPTLLESQSLLNEVWFPTLTAEQKAQLIKSQSLLNEVWFPTQRNQEKADFEGKVVAIPSKWGLVSY